MQLADAHNVPMRRAVHESLDSKAAHLRSTPLLALDFIKASHLSVDALPTRLRPACAIRSVACGRHKLRGEHVNDAMIVL
eukprot:6205218-Pleurochrysis_carterae.AAC.4